MHVSFALHVRKRLEDALVAPDEIKKEILTEIIQEIDRAIDEIYKWYEKEYTEVGNA